MSNIYYTVTGAPGQRAPGTSATMRAEFNLVAAAFDALQAAARFTNLGVGTGVNPIFHTVAVYAGGAVANYLQVASGASGLGVANGTRLGLNAANLGELYVDTGLATYVATVEKTRVNAAGFGVGVTPTVKLHIGATGDVAATIAKFSNAGSTTELTHDATNATFGTDANGKGLVFKTDGGTRWGISPAGTLYPTTNNVYQIGSAGLRCANVFSVLGNFSGAVGINGKTPVANVAAPTVASDLATVITLANDLRTRMINFGIYT